MYYLDLPNSIKCTIIKKLFYCVPCCNKNTADTTGCMHRVKDSNPFHISSLKFRIKINPKNGDNY